VPAEFKREQLAAADWGAYIAHEKRLFEEVHREVVRKILPEERVPSNRYFEGSPVHPGAFKADSTRWRTSPSPGPNASC
jgi:hypothetical protein